MADITELSFEEVEVRMRDGKIYWATADFESYYSMQRDDGWFAEDLFPVHDKILINLLDDNGDIIRYECLWRHDPIWDQIDKKCEPRWQEELANWMEDRRYDD